MPEDQPDLHGASVIQHQARVSSERAVDGIWERGAMRRASVPWIPTCIRTTKEASLQEHSLEACPASVVATGFDGHCIDNPCASLQFNTRIREDHLGTVALGSFQILLFWVSETWHTNLAAVWHVGIVERILLKAPA